MGAPHDHVADRMDEVGLAKTGGAVDEERVVCLSGVLRHLPGGGEGELIGLPLDEVGEPELRLQPDHQATVGRVVVLTGSRVACLGLRGGYRADRPRSPNRAGRPPPSPGCHESDPDSAGRPSRGRTRSERAGRGRPPSPPPAGPQPRVELLQGESGLEIVKTLFPNGFEQRATPRDRWWEPLRGSGRPGSITPSSPAGRARASHPY